MTDRFIRQWAITATAPGVVSEARTWTDIDITFDIEKSADRGINNGKLTLFNLNSDSRKFLSQPLVIVQVDAGYVEDFNTIWSAEIEFCSHSLSGTDWETELTLRDGAAPCRTIEAEKSFDDRTPHVALVNYLITQLTTAPNENVSALTRGVIDLSNITGNMDKGESLNGLAYEELVLKCRGFSTSVYVTDYKLNVVPFNMPLFQDVTILNRDTGLIGTPEITETGVKISALMSAKLEPGALFEVQSNSVNGRYLVENMRYKGESFGNNWNVEIEGLSYG
jgi:hypothetical protein